MENDNRFAWKFLEKKRRVYDQYGKEGLQMPGGKRRHGDDFDPHFGGTFVFRDPEEVFREFFDGIPFEDLFAGKTCTRTRAIPCGNKYVTNTKRHCRISQVFTVVPGEALLGDTVIRLTIV